MKRIFWPAFMGGVVYWFWRYLSPEHSTLVLQDKVVIVTGASSGIGQALAAAFARRGAKVVLVALRPERLEAVQYEIQPYASAVLPICADITDSVQRASIIEQTRAAFGGIDVLVNSIATGGNVTQATPEQIQAIIEVNLTATMLLTHEVIGAMTQGGYIVNITAERSANAVFSASKYGLLGFSHGLRRELVGTGIHVMLAVPSAQRIEMDAEAVVKGLVQGKQELVLGNIPEQLHWWLERLNA
ncbi:MAG: SDR family NAD(P)-dependent oxidoreductase [Anaerolineales bacterium]|nr:SDR family NAD(P)-dependent oxidoreductase [Anaerolineales bacterium]